MKKIALVVILLTFLLVGCNKNTPQIFMSSTPITKASLNFVSDFEKDKKIYFALVNPKGFKKPIVRVQVVKLNPNIRLLGYSMEYARDIEINPANLYMTDYFVLHNSGMFMLRIFSSNNYEHPIAEKVFKVL